MPVRNLHRILSPQSVAVIGASAEEASVGNTLLKNLSVAPNICLYAVNPKHKAIGSHPCWPSMEAIPEIVDLAIICTPAATVPFIVGQCGQHGVRGLVILSAGFREIGEEGSRLEAAIHTEVVKYPGLRILGPNCLGFMSPHANLNASFVNQLPTPGSIAFISQSGALCSAIIDWAAQEQIGLSFLISLGNMLDIGIADLLDYLVTDPYTKSVVLYVESVAEARQLMSAARAFTRHKPIIAYKAGRFAESAKAAASHTGAIAGVDSVYEAAFARAGIVRVNEIEDLFDCAELLARRWRVQGQRLAIVTNAGGPGVMATDALVAHQGTLAQLSDATLQVLDQALSPTWPRSNPVDVIGDATPERFRMAIQAVVNDLNVDGLLVILTPQAMTDPTRTAQAVVEIAATTQKPILTSWMGGFRVAEAIEIFRRVGVPHYTSPEKAVRAFTYLVNYARRQEVLFETPKEIPVEFSADRKILRGECAALLDGSSLTLDEVASKRILVAYGIPVARTLIATTEEEVAQRCREIGFPVVLKLFSPDITHKSDVGGVELNIADERQVRAAFRNIIERAKQAQPNARVHGVTVQQMVTHASGRELIIGAKRDPVFGMVMLVGAGGVMTEVLQDHALELPPLNQLLARRMLESLRSWPLLQGFRGKPAVAIDRLIEALIRFSYLVADWPEIESVDVNPLLATPDGVMALDARIILKRDLLIDTPKPYSHLAIRPYPEELCRNAHLRDGEPVLLRPIRPEDEPLWHEMLRRCSAETLHQRFRYTFKATTHEMATRFCFIDYDREIAIVAEQQTDGARKLLGVGRLVADVDHHQAEFAVLIADPWQHQGLGTILVDCMLQIAKDWAIQKVTAETATDNFRMIKMFERRGFQRTLIPPDTISFAKELGN